ncbi:MAG: hypothetical protein AAB152_13605 [Candidatus Coatesbacteria bacterium]
MNTPLVRFASPNLLRLAARQEIPALPLPGGLELGLVRPGQDALELLSPRDFSRTDWRGFRTLAVDLENRDADEVKVEIMLAGNRAESSRWKRATFTALVPPHRRATWRIPLQQLRYSATWGSPWGWPRQPGLGALESTGLLDTSRVRVIRIGLTALPRTGRIASAGVEDPKWAAPVRIGLYALRLEEPVRPEGWVDRWGQSTAVAWPGKARRDSDLGRADRREALALARGPAFPHRDQFHAWTKRPARGASGYFRVQEVDGRWWLIAPNGRLYYATGMDVVACGVDARLDPAVLAAYSSLPEKEGRFADAWRHGLSLYRANLIRKWGPDYRRRYLDRAIARQLAWGFTSIGNWSDHALFAFRRLPFFSTGPSYDGMRTPLVAKLIHDAFDPGFEDEARKAAASLSVFRYNPWLVGHFLSNEVGWNDFPSRVLELPPRRSARAELIRALRRRYRHVWALNAAWGGAARTWDDVRWPADGVRTGTAERDMAEFRGAFADRWYGGWYRAIRAADPNHLVLGSRLNQGARPDDVIAACARHSEVVSFNHYDIEPWRGEFDRYFALARKPCFIGEYGHNSLDRGLLTAAVPVADQRARAAGYRYYTERLASIPYFVGGHFFQYLDEPVTGRFDRETAFNGFVDITDQPYPLMVAAARASHGRIFDVHAGTARPYSAPPAL